MTRVMLPAGEYWVGDTGYLLGDESRRTFYDCFGGDHPRNSVGLYKGKQVVSFRLDGDGTYEGTDGYEYAVDGGSLGLLPVGLEDPARLAEWQGEVPCRKVVFPREFVCEQTKDYVRFGHLKIEAYSSWLRDEY